MAEFKLGRIRFVWKGNWTASNEYYKDDVVRNGGNTYVCIAGHISSDDFPTDLESFWNKISDGQEWKDDWDTDTYYKVNDIVKYGGYLYIANTAHTSAATFENGLEADSSKWDLFAEGFDYKSLWTTSERYKVNDIVKYNSTIYICIDAHTSASTSDAETGGLESDSDKWEFFSKGIEWRDTWTINTEYRLNDVVRYGGKVYVCNTGHTSSSSIALGLEDDQNKWDDFHKGIEYRNTWSPSVRYRINDVVKYGAGLWICETPHTSDLLFTTDEDKWSQFVEGFEFEDSWDKDTLYQPGDFVTYGGYNFVAVTNNSNSKPTENPNDWDLFNTGFRFVGDYQTDSTNQHYKVGDVVRVGGYTYLCIQDHDQEIHPGDSENFSDWPEYWERLNSGLFWKEEWTNGDFYDLGDVVSYTTNVGTVNESVNSYVCVQTHTADDSVDENSPEQDLLGEYWNILAGGPENGVLDQDGDLLIYSGSGPSRLPIGQNGQVLAVDETTQLPAWKFFGSKENVWYVNSNDGFDRSAPVNGTTIDQPWASIEYAAKEVELGALNPNAKSLLILNRAFIQQEITQYIDYQIAESNAPFTGDYSEYDSNIAFVDVGIIVDAIIHDLSYSGNTDVRQAAIDYDNNDLVLVENKSAENNDVLDYLDTLIDAVISNVDPDTSYQTLNSATPVFDQFKDSELDEELNAQTIISSLIGIITETVTNGTANLPEQIIPNNTIFVKTGIQSEVLPISVPQQTAIVGDELRSTKVTPAAGFVQSNDVPKSLDAVDRLKNIVDSIVLGVDDITASSTNTESYVDTNPVVGNSAVSDIVTDLFQQIFDYVDFELNGGTQDSTTPLIAGANTPQTSTNYTFAREAIAKNKDFLIAEAIAFVKDEYPSYTVNEDHYQDFFARYIDAVQYDLIYTGNYKSLTAARYYVNSVLGSVTENMFFLRNGTGLRNCTVTGLDGRRVDNTTITDIDPELLIIDQEYKITNLGDTDWNNVAGTTGETYAVDDRIVVVQPASSGTTGTASPTGLRADIEYDTLRPLAGAYCSLDPGWGPADERVWIRNKSPYVQNVTTFGTGCIGMKVDGDLHNSGNDSIVANDFTQVLSDGIGAWVTNLGRSELVSVFSYYGYIGYLAENGGKIRATNGNSSYGSFGTISEGVDNTEIPITAKVDNRSFEAIVDSVLTDGDDILVFQYLNAGQDYTPAETEFTISGDGFNEEIDSITTETGGIFEVRLLDPNDNLGGEDYVSRDNTAQIGDATGITISATDPVATAGEYEGMAVWLVAGKGAGQYGYIDSYNPGTKRAEIYKYSDDTPGWDHVTGKSIENSLDSSTAYVIEPRLTFDPPPGGGYAESAKGRAVVDNGKISKVLIWDPGSGYTQPAADQGLTIVDPNNTVEAPYQIRVADGVLSQPTWIDRGTAYNTASIAVSGDGFADRFQPGQFVRVKNLSERPQPGSNIEFAGLPNQYFKLVVVREFLGDEGDYTAQFQISPNLTVSEAPDHDEDMVLRIRYSQVRLTGHDFLDIGTGNKEETNYPNEPEYEPDSEAETTESGGGRVFFTTTDQDGNFRVGDLFSVEQATGVASLNADAFNIAGLQELSLGELALGGSGARIEEFSTDGTFAANSDNIVPTQRAIRTYITSQIGGGAATLNVNSITAGQVQIDTDRILTTSGNQINVLQKMNFPEGVDGVPLAMHYFLN